MARLYSDEDFPHAWAYAREHKDEIDRQIEEPEADLAWDN